MGEKYKNKIKILKPKEIQPRFKVVSLPGNLEESQIRNKIIKCNRWIPEGALELEREYTSFASRKNVVYKCNANLLTQVLKRQKVRIDLEEFKCFEDYELLQCFKCQSFGHSSNNCKKELACKICSGSHHHSQCRSDRGESLNPRTRGGRVAIITRQTVGCDRISLPRPYDIEACVVKISTANNIFAIVAVYIAHEIIIHTCNIGMLLLRNNK